MTIAIVRFRYSQCVYLQGDRCVHVYRQQNLDICAGGTMEAVYFLVFWVGAATIHTVFELKVRPHLDKYLRNTENRPYL